MLGPGPHERGAECENIPESLPGVGYQVLDGFASPVKGRASWVTDDDIAWMVERYPARRGDVIDTTATAGAPSSDSTVIGLPSLRPVQEPPESAA